MNEQERKRYRMLLLGVAGVTAVICLVIVFFFRIHVVTDAIKGIAGVLTPFIYGVAIAYLLRPIALKFEEWLTKAEEKVLKRRNRGLLRLLSILLSLAAMLVVIFLLFMMILPELINSIANIVTQLPGAVKEFQDWIATLDNGGTSHEVVLYVQQAVETVIEKAQSFLTTDLLPTMQSLITNVTSSFMNILGLLKDFGLGCIVAAYLLGSWEKFHKQAGLIVYALFPRKGADWIANEVKVADSMFSGFIHGKLLDSLIIGIITFVFTSLTRMPYAVLVSVIVGVTNIIPFFGPYIGAIPSALIILTVSPFKCVVFLIFCILLQQFDGNFLGPHILGNKLGIGGIWILFSIMIFSAMFGFVGMLIGVPVFAIIYDLIRRMVVCLLGRRGQRKRLEKYQEFSRDLHN